MKPATLLTLGAAALIAGAIVPSSPAHAAGNVQQTIQNCETCHGDGGASKHPEIPIIGGMSDYYLEGEIKIYQKKLRPCPAVEYPGGPHKGEKASMCDLVKDLSEGEVQQIATYFADKPFVPADQKFDQALAAKGKKVHEQACSKCHSEGGSLAFDDASILAGQWRKYLEQTFAEIRDGKRWIPEKMKPKMKELSDADVKALVEYYVSEGSKK